MYVGSTKCGAEVQVYKSFAEASGTLAEIPDTLLQIGQAPLGFIGRLASRIPRDKSFERFLGGSFFIRFLMAASNVEHRVRRLGAVRILAE